MAARSRKAARVSSVATATAGAMLVLAASAGASVQAVGHRGGMDAGAEHALDTFRRAIAMGTDAVEFDVRFTKDRVAVIFHDTTVDRMTDCTGLVSSFTLARLQACSINVKAGQPRQAVPTLNQVLKVLAPSKVKIYVHVKEGSSSQAKKIVASLNKYGLNTTKSSKNRTVVFADASKASYVENMKKAGAKRLGIIFNRSKGWSSPYPVIIAYNTPVTRALVVKAQKAGKFVMAVEGRPVKASQVAALGLNGFIADNLTDYLVRVGRLEDPKITAAREAAVKAEAERVAAEKAAAEKAAAEKAAADKAEADRIAAEAEAARLAEEKRKACEADPKAEGCPTPKPAPEADQPQAEQQTQPQPAPAN